MVDFEENVEEMMGTTREAVATASSGDEMATRPRTRPGTRRRRRLVIGGVMYTDEGELEFHENEMAALEGQRLVAEYRCGI